MISTLARLANHFSGKDDDSAVKYYEVKQIFERLCDNYRLISRIDKSQTRVFFSYDNRMIDVLTDFLIGQAFAVYETNNFKELVQPG